MRDYDEQELLNMELRLIEAKSSVQTFTKLVGVHRALQDMEDLIQEVKDQGAEIAQLRYKLRRRV